MQYVQNGLIIQLTNGLKNTFVETNFTPKKYDKFKQDLSQGQDSSPDRPLPII